LKKKNIYSKKANTFIACWSELTVGNFSVGQGEKKRNLLSIAIKTNM